MGLRQFRDLLVRDSGELIIVPGAPPGDTFAELLWAWRSARDECKAAYDAWCRSPSSTEYVIHQAAADRADAAQDALAGAWRREER